nr:unnamed protein product [Callosobruchus chinensis]
MRKIIFTTASPLIEQLTFFHDHALLILIIITILVGQLMITLFLNKFTHRYLLEDFKNIEFDSYIIPIDEIKNYNFRLLDTDNRITVPYDSQIRIIITAADVIHS